MKQTRLDYFQDCLMCAVLMVFTLLLSVGWVKSVVFDNIQSAGTGIGSILLVFSLAGALYFYKKLKYPWKDGV